MNFQAFLERIFMFDIMKTSLSKFYLLLLFICSFTYVITYFYIGGDDVARCELLGGVVGACQKGYKRSSGEGQKRGPPSQYCFQLCLSFYSSPGRYSVFLLPLTPIY